MDGGPSAEGSGADDGDVGWFHEKAVSCERRLTRGNFSRFGGRVRFSSYTARNFDRVWQPGRLPYMNLRRLGRCFLTSPPLVPKIQAVRAVCDLSLSFCI